MRKVILENAESFFNCVRDLPIEELLTRDDLIELHNRCAETTQRIICAKNTRSRKFFDDRSPNQWVVTCLLSLDVPDVIARLACFDRNVYNALDNKEFGVLQEILQSCYQFDLHSSYNLDACDPDRVARLHGHRRWLHDIVCALNLPETEARSALQDGALYYYALTRKYGAMRLRLYTFHQVTVSAGEIQTAIITVEENSLKTKQDSLPAIENRQLRKIRIGRTRNE